MHDDDETPAARREQRWTALRAAVVRAVRRQCPAWLSADAEDIAQVAVAKVMAAGKAGEGNPELPASYLYKVAHSALVDEIRRRRRRREEALEPDGPGGETRPGARASGRGQPGERRAAARARRGGACMPAGNQARAAARGDVVPPAAHRAGGRAAARLGLKQTENLVYRGLADLRQCLLAKGHRP